MSAVMNAVTSADTPANRFDSDKHLHAQFYVQRDGFVLDVDMRIPTDGVTAIFGPSGCGKTTLLRCMAGLEQTPHGRFSWRDHQFASAQIWQDEQHFVPTHKRPLGYVFQEASLFAHLTVNGNLAYAKKRRGKTAAARDHVLNDDAILHLLGIEHLLQRKPHELSGGERQRVAIARALMIHPKILFMDEPLASLDDKRKREVLPYLEQLKTQLNIPIIYVTHSADEIARLADHVVVMSQGEVVRHGSLAQILTDLNNPLKLGQEAGVVVTGQIQEKDEQWQLMQVAFDGGAVWLKDSGHKMGDYVRIRLLAKDISLSLSHAQDSSIQNILPCTICQIEDNPQAAYTLVKVHVGKSELLARLTRKAVAQLDLSVGKDVWVQIKSAALV